MLASAALSLAEPCFGENVTIYYNGTAQVYTTYRYTFDRVYGPNSEQADVYEHSAKDAVHQALEVRQGWCHLILPTTFEQYPRAAAICAHQTHCGHQRWFFLGRVPVPEATT